MKIGNGIVCVAVGVCLGAVILAASPAREDPARQTLLAMLASSDVIEANADPLTASVEPTQGFVSLATFKGRLGPMEKKIFQEKDGWGRDILYWSDGWNYMLLSRGADGVADIDYGASLPPYADAPTGLTTAPTQDIIIVNGEIQIGPFLSRQAAPSSLTALRSIGTACEEYSIDNNFYPSPEAPLGSVEAIRPSLESIYIRRLPLLDGWGNPVLYWRDRRPGAQAYAVISVGVDGVPEHPYETWTANDFLTNSIGPFTDLRHDTIFMQGQFIQYPQQTVRPIDLTRRSMADMRSIGTAVEEYAIDNNFYPGSGGGAVPVSALTSALTPWYIRQLPVHDAWDQPYLYFSNNASYWIISTGSDRSAENPYQTWRLNDFQNYPGGAFPTLDRDIIFSQGQFIQYPSFIQT